MSGTVASAWRNFRDVLRVRRSPRVSRMLCNEGAQRLAAVVDHRPAVCEQQMIEFELARQAPVGGNQPRMSRMPGMSGIHANTRLSTSITSTTSASALLEALN